MEALSRMMSTMVDKGLLSRFLVGLRNHELMVVLQLLFANDTLSFCEPSGEQFEI
jgi:hypothetical protein